MQARPARRASDAKPETSPDMPSSCRNAIPYRQPSSPPPPHQRRKSGHAAKQQAAKHTPPAGIRVRVRAVCPYGRLWLRGILAGGQRAEALTRQRQPQPRTRARKRRRAAAAEFHLRKRFGRRSTGASASSTIAMTANAPQWESFRIFCLVARSRRESTASQTSI